MTIQYKKTNDSTIYTEDNVIIFCMGQCKDGYFINYTVNNDSQDRIICPIDLESIKITNGKSV